MRLRSVAILLAGLFAATASLAQSGDDNIAIDMPGGRQVQIDPEVVRGVLSFFRGVARQIAFQWGTSQDARYGLFLDEDWLQRTVDRPLAVIVHGYNSTPEEFETFRDVLRDAGFGCAVFAYPNDAPVDFSGRQFAAALDQLERRYPDRDVALIAHSMGGLVSRVVLEDPEAVAPDNVEQLIMVATPNQGSNLARIPVSTDIWQLWLEGKANSVRDVFFESVIDGLNEARLDLQPESELLARLNSLPRNPNVHYSLLLGNSGPATREQIDELRRLILSRQDTNIALRALGPRLEELLVDLDELVDGVGDGAVAVERGRLDGVDDTIVLAFRHGTITTVLADDSSRALIAAILERLGNPSGPTQPI